MITIAMDRIYCIIGLLDTGELLFARSDSVVGGS
jgi:hypothetical protein